MVIRAQWRRDIDTEGRSDGKNVLEIAGKRRENLFKETMGKNTRLTVTIVAPVYDDETVDFLRKLAATHLSGTCHTRKACTENEDRETNECG